MHQREWCSARLSITVVNLRTFAHEQGGDQTTTRGLPLARVGFTLLGLALPLLATGQGRALLAGVLRRHFRHALLPKLVDSSGRGPRRLPAGPQVTSSP